MGLTRTEQFNRWYGKYLCDKDTDFVYDVATMSSDAPGLTDVTSVTLRQAGFKLANDPTELFNQTRRSNPDLIIGGSIKSMRLFSQLCDGEEGAATIRVEWQIFDPLKRSVIYRTETTGTGSAKRIPKAFSHAQSDAVANAAKVFANDPQVRLLLLTGPAPDPIAVAAVAPKIRIPKSSRPVLARHMTDVTPAVVTVRTGDGHGSGFYVARDLVLTNWHVVGDASRVMIHPAEGVEVEGQVEMRDQGRDVALVRVKDASAAQLVVEPRLPETGAEVYAIGSPLDELFAGTLTKGVVSGMRTIDGKRYIQSDVSIQPGNSGGPLVDKDGQVVGIAVIGYRPGNANTGINLFIPIREALDALGIEMTEEG